MKLSIHLNCDIVCAACFYAMYPLPEYLPRRIVYCAHESCPRFHIAVEIKPIEVDAVDILEIVVPQP